MTNKEYANQFQLLAKLMELHGESSYRIKSYNNAYRILRGVADPVHSMTLTELKSIKGIGDAIGQKTLELQRSGSMQLLEEYRQQTPSGIIELMGIKGLGIKKILTLWQELQIASPGELLHACEENRLVELKGFGVKTQKTIRERLEYYFRSQDKLHYAVLEEAAHDLVLDIQDVLGPELVQLTGQIRRLEPILKAIVVLIGTHDIQALFEGGLLQLERQDAQAPVYYCRTTADQFPVILCTSDPDFFGYNLVRTTGPEAFNAVLFEQLYAPAVDWRHNNPPQLQGWSEAQILAQAGLPWVDPEIRDVPKIALRLKGGSAVDLIQSTDIRGIVHAHSNWSDGGTSIEVLASYVQEQGYAYLGLTDHSKSAFYANGLDEDRILKQHAEIDELNKELAPFRIFKGIESDILADGSLDYSDEVLASFDFIVSSIHSVLNMDRAKATARLIKAIENPYTTILGHPTGRLLLRREGYPIDHKAVIDACAEHEVIIEINATPWRIDLDWRWERYALEKGEQIAINPDAHEKAGYADMRYGLLVGRIAGLTAAQTFNALSAEAVADWFEKRKVRQVQEA